MRTPQAVIGSGLGDEGKGHVVDYLAAQAKDPVVVRFNGGAQAGHTVVTPDGKRHVFHHYGSGTLAGAKTYLSEFFVVNPLVFTDETKELKKINALSFRPAIDRDCLVTTPYDMIINQIVETARGNNRHGSCGLGINETITRNGYDEYILRYSDLYNDTNTLDILHFIKRNWVPERLEQLNFKNIPENMADLLTSDQLILRYLEDIKFLINNSLLTDFNHLYNYDQIIFEGAQGLMLDEDHSNFPYVSRSKTGLDNIIKIAENFWPIDSLNVFYLTRPYATRHGAGPLLHEVEEKPYKNIIDETNITNDWQGSLRFGFLDLDLLSFTIKSDHNKWCDNLDMSLNFVVNCFDQIDNNTIKFVVNNEHWRTKDQTFMEIIDALIEPDNIWIGTGPTREHIKKYC